MTTCSRSLAVMGTPLRQLRAMRHVLCGALVFRAVRVSSGRFGREGQDPTRRPRHRGSLPGSPCGSLDGSEATVVSRGLLARLLREARVHRSAGVDLSRLAADFASRDLRQGVLGEDTEASFAAGAAQRHERAELARLERGGGRSPEAVPKAPLRSYDAVSRLRGTVRAARLASVHATCGL